MSAANEVLKKFEELENTMNMQFPKVDPILIVDLVLRQKKDNKRDPIYTLEVFIKPDQDIEAIRDRIISEAGMAPAFSVLPPHTCSGKKPASTERIKDTFGKPCILMMCLRFRDMLSSVFFNHSSCCSSS